MTHSLANLMLTGDEWQAVLLSIRVASAAVIVSLPLGIAFGYVAQLFYVLASLDAGMDVHHTCRETLCFNPEHLQSTGRGVNVREGNARRSKRLCVCCGSGELYYHAGHLFYCLSCDAAGVRAAEAESVELLEEADEYEMRTRTYDPWLFRPGNDLLGLQAHG